LRGDKGHLYEGGCRVAAFANWPGVLAPRKLTAPLHAADWMPTFTKLAGWKPATPPKFDGQDVWPLLTGKVEKPEARTIYIPMVSGAAVFDGEWKLMVHKVKGKSKTELFHIAADPYEEKDLAAAEPGRVKELQARLAELRRDDQTELPADLKDIPK
jgi:arylsulfatase A-like enzyme